jgi:hypothetical protein
MVHSQPVVRSGAKVGHEPSTGSRRWDSGKACGADRLGLTHPPAPAGGIQRRFQVVLKDAFGVSPAEMNNLIAEYADKL